VELLIGTGDGVYMAGASDSPKATDGLAGHSVRALRRANGNVFAGADSGVFRSSDGGRSWKLSGVDGQIVWDIAASPGQPDTLFVGTQPAALYRSGDRGESWSEIDSLKQVPGSDRWCVPSSPLGARALTIVLDRADPARWWVGLEVGGILSTSNGGASWSCDQPGGNPDIHGMVADPGRPGVLYATTGFGRMDDSEPREQRIAGVFRSDDGGRSWRYLWEGMQPPYTRPMCIDPRAPHALTVGCAPSAFSSYRDEGGAKAMLYQSVDGGQTFKSLGDTKHSPSAANLLTVSPGAEPGSVLVGTDTGEVWSVTAQADWRLLVSGLPMIQALLPLD